MNFAIRLDPITGQKYLAVPYKGKVVLTEPFINKGTAFTERERDELELRGLMPTSTSTMALQLERTYENYRKNATMLERYSYLTALHDRNETLFFRLVYEHIEEMMPVIYTPVVGEACQRYSHIFRYPRGLYIGYQHKGNIERVLRNSGRRNVSVIVVTDGERILGLGDQGIGGMGISIGKLCLYTLCAGIPPFTTLPICLDVGTNNEERLADPLYLGRRHHRITGGAYQEFIDEFVAAVQKVYPQALLQWEDFLKENAIRQLKRFRDRLCTFNDDIQGTAGVVLAGIFGGLRISAQPLRDQKILLAGAGAAAQGISELIVSAMIEAGLSREQAIARIWMVDSRGLVSRARSGLEAFKATFARPVEDLAAIECQDREKISLLETVCHVKPSILLGTSATPGMFDEAVVRAAAEHCQRPMIFPLSNPTSRSECTPEQAIRWSEGRAIVATGSPFDPVEYEGRRFRIGQGNNAFIFPGIGLGVSVARSCRVTDGMILEAARTLADQVTEQDLAEGSVYPDLKRIREVSRRIAMAVVKKAVEEKHADGEILEYLNNAVCQAMWFPEYLPIRYEPLIHRRRDDLLDMV